MTSHVFSRLDVGVFKASRGDGVGLKDGEERVSGSFFEILKRWQFYGPLTRTAIRRALAS
jgi:hypothetical protein